MPIARPEPYDTRVIAHVDMDCFYVQVEQRKQPNLRGVPTAVVQYNPWKGGGLIAVGYEARKFGVKRSMRGDEAKKVCPDIQLIQVPVARGKADLNLYRKAGSEVVSILSTKGRCERASIDEVYLDLTEAAEMMLVENPPESLEEMDEEILNSHVLGVTSDEDDRKKSVRWWICRANPDHRDKLLACGAIIVARLRMKVLEETTFTCSAGIAHNKMLAKLASAMHKPAQQTVVPTSSVKDLLATFPVKKMKQLGGKLGSSLQSDLGVNTIGDLLPYSVEKLQELYGVNTGSWLWNIARGINGEEVEGRILPKSHGCGKTFSGPQALKTTTAVEHWLNQLCEELSERIQSDFDLNKRVAHTLTLHANAYKGNDVESQKKFPSKSCPLRYGTAKIQEDAKRLFDSALREFTGCQNTGWRITSLSVGASKILDTPPLSETVPRVKIVRHAAARIDNLFGTCSIMKYFQGKNLPSTSCSEFTNIVQDDCPSSPSESISYTAEIEDVKQTESEFKATGSRIISHQDTSLQSSGKLDKKAKDKGTCSILSYFQSTNCKQANHDSSSLGSDKCTTSNQTQRNNWALNVEDIDPSVIAELPPEIQKEVRGWLHPNKRLNTTKRGTINHYFSSA